MNENHIRILLVTFQHVNGLLSEAERIMNSKPSEPPFQEYLQDSSPAQRLLMREEILRIREMMQRIVSGFHISPNQPTTGAVWAAHTHLAYASQALVEIQAKHMKGFGDLSDEDRRLLDNISAEVREPIDHLGKTLLNGERTHPDTTADESSPT
jgi:hypothetical protein